MSSCGIVAQPWLSSGIVAQPWLSSRLGWALPQGYIPNKAMCCLLGCPTVKDKELKGLQDGRATAALESGSPIPAIHPHAASTASA